MPVKTLSDCAECLAMPVCSAHVPDGEWEHDSGIDPCVVKIDECKCPPGCTSDCAGCRYNWEENDKEDLLKECLETMNEMRKLMEGA